MLDAALDRIAHAARRAKARLRAVLVALWVAGWAGCWGVLALIGAVAGQPRLVGVSLGALGATALVVLVVRVRRRRRLTAQAAEALLARAALHGLALDPDLAALLHAFDVRHGETTRLLDAHPLLHDDARRRAHAVQRQIRDHLWSAVVDAVALRRTIGTMARGPGGSAVRAEWHDAHQAADRRRAEAEQILEDARALHRRLVALQDPADAPAPTTRDRHGALQRALADLARTAQAYREVEQTERRAAQGAHAARTRRSAR